MSDILHPHAGRVIVPGFAPERAVDYNTIEVDDDEDVKVAKVEGWLAKQIGSALAKAYPSRDWGVGVNLAKGETLSGVVTVMCPSLSATKGHVLHISNETAAGLVTRGIRAGGEILERYGITRNRKFDSDALETLDRNPLTDEAISDDARIVMPNGGVV